MPESESSLPPSQPRPSRTSTSLPSSTTALPTEARPARAQLVVALLLGCLLVAIPLYLRRRPHVPDDPAAASIVPLAGEVAAPGSASAAPVGSTATSVVVSAPTILECHDKGNKKTPPEGCDRLPVFEKALVDAVNGAASCVPAGMGTGTIEYVLDVNFTKKKIQLFVPKDGRTLRNVRAASACQASVKRGLPASLDGALDGTHAHSRYKIAVTATYGH